MNNNGTIRLAIPPGQVQAHCLTCKTDVVIPEGTLRCSHGDHDVEPTSLPRFPMQARSLAEVDATRAPSQPVVTAGDGAIQAIPLPPIKEALSWHGATQTLRDQLAAEETQLQERLRQVRQTRRLLDQVLERVSAPENRAAATRPGSKLWAPQLGLTCCRICGSSTRKHGSHGRCGTCANHFRKTGEERFAIESTTTEVSEHDN